MKLGLIGLGLMGTEIAIKLAGAGQYVCGWDIDPSRRDALSRLGIDIATDAQQVFNQCDPVFLSLPTHEIVRELLSSHLPKNGTAVVDTTTGSSESAEQIARELAEKGVSYLDATISGSSLQLANGSASMLVGAAANDFRQHRALLELLTPAVFYVGPPGSGTRMKLVTNLVLGLNRAALAEGLSFAASQGLDMDLTLNMLKQSMSYSRIMDTKGEKMIRRDFTPQAKLSQHLKDVRLILQSSQEHGVDLPLSQTHRLILERAVQMGLGELDNSAIINTY